ncbi:hypothetical protein GCM10029964_112980 [Kibdelosporangium lantanae]
MEPMSAVDVIRTKRDGHRLTDDQIDWVVDAYTRGVVADEQMSALAMAIFLNGMDTAEASRLTQAMIDSGETLDLRVSRPTVDKHSTGGVGDKITLPLAPLVAACGAAVPQLSGRGLGHTGGTLDKLESVPGWRAQLSTEEITRQLEDVGAVVCAATEGLAPADRKLYALRDVTSTVESIPLIASSIMSKKIAEGASGLVLDVKVGSGAFMKTLDNARALAEALVGIGKQHGRKVTALLTDMSVPLGRAVGNAVEVQESVDVLKGGGPSDIVELTVALAREMLALAGISEDPARVLADGRAYETWCRMISVQGGDPEAPCRRPSTYTRSPRRSRGRWWSWTRTRWVWRRGGWGRAGLVRRTRSSTPLGSSATRSPVTTWRPARCCWSCARTPPTRSRARWPRWTAATGSGTVRWRSGRW